jgi:UDP-glucose 4-epimerase
MKILITGVSGCIGNAVAKELLAKGYDVIGIDTQVLNKNFQNSKFKFINGSILDKTFLRDAVAGCDAVVHLAAHLGVKRTEVNRLRCLDINVDGTKNVLEAAHSTGTVKKFIFASSSEVYGEPIENPVSENSITQGKTIYAISKLAGEELVKAYQQELKAFDTCVLRYFNTYGPGQVGQFVITRFLNRVLNNKSPIINGAGDQLRSYCFSRDTARATVQALENKECSGITLNIGNSYEPITLLELANKIIKLAGKEGLEPKILGDKFGDRVGDREINYRFSDTSLAEKVLKFKAETSLDSGLRELIEAGLAKDTWDTYEKDYDFIVE